jgi:Fungal specific transcription factor domain
MIDITDCRDLQTLQTIVFMIVFLQSTAKLATCYAYIGIALRTCCRLGMHRNIELPNNKNVIEREERRRTFWLVRKLDTYVGTMLGLPQMLSDDDIDQQYPIEVPDEYIFEDGIRTPPADAFSLLKATNAHTRLTGILRKVIRYVYPVKGGTSASDARYSISHARIREIERDLQQWMDALPTELRPSDSAGDELSR